MELIAEAVALVRSATHDGDYDQAWNLVEKAAKDPSAAADLGFAMVGSLDAAERKIGFDLLGCVAHTDQAIARRLLTTCLDRGAVETDHAVQAAIARALGCTGDARAVPELLRLAGHPDEDVRLYVAWSLPLACQNDDAAVETLIRLSTDPVGEVRDWATFALGTLCKADGPRIRAALWARVDDEDTEVREEAVAGLARRRDRRISPHVAQILDRDGVGHQMFEAIACLADSALLPHLDGYEGESAAEAMRECDPELRRARDAFAAELTQTLHIRKPDLSFGVYGEICEPGLTLSVSGHGSIWRVEELDKRAHGDPAVAAELVTTDLHEAPDAMR